MKLIKKSINHLRDYFNIKSPKLKVESINRALSKDLEDSRVFNRTPAEDLMHFLYLFGRDDTANNIRSLVNSNEYVRDTLGHQEKIKAFLNALLQTSHEVFEIDLGVIQNSVTHYSHEEIVNYYQDNNLANDLQKIEEYKKLLAHVFRTMGYNEPVYNSLYPELLDDTKLTEEKFINDFATKVVLQTNADRTLSVIQVCSIDPTFKLQAVSSNHLEKNKDHRYQKLKSRTFNILLIMSITVGMTESFLPYYFVFNSISELHLSRSVLITFSSVAFISAFLISSLVFHTGSFTAFENIFLKPKSVLFYDEEGNKLPWYGICKNLIAVLFAIVAAITLTGLSFSFYSKILPVKIAYLCVIANLVGWTGLLITAVISILNKKTIDEIILSLQELLFQPVKQIFKNFRVSNALFNLSQLSLNIIVIVAIIFFSIGVNSATYVLFVSSLRDVIATSSTLLQYFKPDDAFYITVAAMVPLSIFLVKNISRIVNFIRLTIQDSIKKIYSLSRINQNYLMKRETAAYRKKAAKFRNKLAVIFALCSFINGISGSVGLYTNSAVAESVIKVALFFGVSAKYVPAVITASVFATIANLFASIGNTMFPVLNTVMYDKAMNRRRDDFSEDYFNQPEDTDNLLNNKVELILPTSNKVDTNLSIITNLAAQSQIEPSEAKEIITDLSTV